MKKIILSILLLSLFGIAASAESEISSVSPAVSGNDSGLWGSIQINKGWDVGAYMFLRGEYRSYESFASTEAVFGALGAGYNFTKWLKADLSYEFWKTYPGGERTTHKVILCTTGTLVRGGLSVSLREKLECAIPQAEVIEWGENIWNLRSRLRVQYKIGGGLFRPYAMYEIFTWSNWRRSLHYVGTEIYADKHNMFDIFYMFNLPNGTTPIHTLGVGYYLNF